MAGTPILSNEWKKDDDYKYFWIRDNDEAVEIIEPDDWDDEHYLVVYWEKYYPRPQGKHKRGEFKTIEEALDRVQKIIKTRSD